MRLKLNQKRKIPKQTLDLDMRSLIYCSPDEMVLFQDCYSKNNAFKKGEQL